MTIMWHTVNRISVKEKPPLSYIPNGTARKTYKMPVHLHTVHNFAMGDSNLSVLEQNDCSIKSMLYHRGAWPDNALLH